MDTPKIFESEYRFCLILWEHEPITATELAKLSLAQLGWKRTTTYTVLKKLCQQGLFENRDGVVHVRMSREDYGAMQSQRFVEENFGGSLPAFLAAFTARKPLTAAQIDEIRSMIDEYGEGNT